MRERVAKFNVQKIKPQDLAGAAGPPDEETLERKPNDNLIRRKTCRARAGEQPAPAIPELPRTVSVRVR